MKLESDRLSKGAVCVEVDVDKLEKRKGDG